MLGDTCWLVLSPNVPEYSTVWAGEEDFLVDTVFDWDERPLEVEKDFRHWLADLPIGQIAPLLHKPDYRIVKCRSAVDF